MPRSSTSSHDHADDDSGDECIVKEKPAKKRAERRTYKYKDDVPFLWERNKFKRQNSDDPSSSSSITLLPLVTAAAASLRYKNHSHDATTSSTTSSTKISDHHARRSKSRSDETVRMRGGSSHILHGMNIQLQDDMLDEETWVPKWVIWIGRICGSAVSAVRSTIASGISAENVVAFSIAVSYMAILMGMTFFLYRFLEKNDFLLKYMDLTKYRY